MRESLCFRAGDARAMLREPIIPAARIVEGGIGTLVGFFDQAFGEQFFDGAVKCAGAKANLIVSRLGDLLHDCVAVPILSTESQKNMKSGGR